MSPKDESQPISIFDNIIATDPARAAVQSVPPIEKLVHKPTDGFQPLNLAHLNASDWSVVVAALMQRLDVTTLTITEASLKSLEESPGFVRVLACTIHPDTSDVRFTLLQSPKSEFRS